MKKFFLVCAITMSLFISSCVDEVVEPQETKSFAHVLTRVQNEGLKIVQKDGLFMGFNQKNHFKLTFDNDGVFGFSSVKKKNTEDILLKFAGISRNSEEVGVFDKPIIGLGKCLKENRVDTKGHCIQRVEIKRGNTTEWYNNADAEIEHGFDITDRPKGVGNLLIKINVENSEVRQAGKAVEFIQNNKKVAQYKNLFVIDAVGKKIEGKIKTVNNHIFLVIDDSTLVYPIVVDPSITVVETTLTKKISGPTGNYGHFGYSISMSGERMIVGAYYEVSSTGAAYVFERNTGGIDNWGLIKKLQGTGYNRFGMSVSISGERAIVGAHYENTQTGSAYIFEKDQGGVDNWGEVKKLLGTQSGGFFGSSVVVSGERVVVGAYRENSTQGAVYIFEKDYEGVDNWGEVKKLQGLTDSYFGYAISISGERMVAGADGENSSEGAVYLFEKNHGGTDNWGMVKRITGSTTRYSCFGHSLSIDNDMMIIGASDEGAAYIFERNHGGENSWGEVKKLSITAEHSGFGCSVAIDEKTAVVGADREDSWMGVAYIFDKNTDGIDNWGQIKRVSGAIEEYAYFGATVFLGENTVIVGSYAEDSDVGAIYIYSLTEITVFSPEITSNGGGDTASIDVDENSLVVTTVTATDDDDDTVAFSITGGVDQNKFSINNTSGLIVFKIELDYENPEDSNTDNIYEVEITATDNSTYSLIDTQTLFVTIKDIDDYTDDDIVSDSDAFMDDDYTEEDVVSDSDAFIADDVVSDSDAFIADDVVSDIDDYRDDDDHTSMDDNHASSGGCNCLTIL